MKSNEESLFKEIVNVTSSVIEEVYIYNHLSPKAFESTNDKKLDEYLATTIMCVLVAIFSTTILKMFLIFLYFFFCNTVYNICKFFVFVYRKKCLINLSAQCKNAYSYLSKIFKKIYTYNFYSYENKPFGYVIVIVYICFLLFNILYTTEYIIILKGQKYDDIMFRGFHIIAFEFHIFIELICCTFYIYRKLWSQYKFILISYIGLNILICIITFLKINYDFTDDCNDFIRRVAHLVFLIYFATLYFISFMRVKNYNLNCNIAILIFSRMLEIFIFREREACE